MHVFQFWNRTTSMVQIWTTTSIFTFGSAAMEDTKPSSLSTSPVTSSRAAFELPALVARTGLAFGSNFARTGLAFGSNCLGEGAGLALEVGASLTAFSILTDSSSSSGRVPNWVLNWVLERVGDNEFLELACKSEFVERV